MKRLGIGIICGLLVAAVTSCSKSGDSVSSDGGLSSLTGDLAGSVSLYDRENQPLGDNSGVIVTCDGTNFTTQTDASGRWVIHGLSSRTYSVSFSKPGFSSYKIRSLVFLGGGVINAGSIIMSAVPDFTVTLDLLIVPAAPTVDSLGRTISNDGMVLAHTSANAPFRSYAPAMLFLGKHQGIDPSDPDSYLYTVGLGSVATSSPASDTTLSLKTTLFYSNFWSVGFQAGDSLYVRAYPKGMQMNEFDPTKSKTVYVGLGEGSNTLSGVVR